MKINYQDLLRAARGQMTYCGVNPAIATEYQIEDALNGVRPKEASAMTDYQFSKFTAMFRKWQKESK